MPKKRIIGKAQKRRRRNRQEYARINDLYFEDRQPKDVTDIPPNDDLTLALVATVASLAKRRH